MDCLRCFKKPKKSQNDADFTRPECEFLELNNIGLDNEELKILPKIKKDKITKGEIIGK